MNAFVSVLLYALDIYALVVVVRVFSTWIPGAHGYPIMRYIADVTDPVLGPIGRVVPTLAGLDFSPMVLLFLIWGLQELLRMLLIT